MKLPTIIMLRDELRVLHRYISLGQKANALKKLWYMGNYLNLIIAKIESEKNNEHLENKNHDNENTNH